MATSVPRIPTRDPRGEPVPDSLRPSTELIANRYLITEELAAGGMGTVYRVLDRSTGQERALKRLKPEALGEPHLIEAFEREYQVLAGLDHPRIIRVFDYGVDAGGPYYSMEMVAGQDMRKAAPLPFRDACRCLRDVATSLALLHAQRLLHRDLSPGNVRLTEDGHCKLLDFGALAPFGSAHLLVGTAPAVPPEALDGAPLDQRADLYSLGALAYWMLTGRHAYPARRFEDLPQLWKVVPPAPSAIVADVPRELDELVLSLLSANPSVRPASAAEIISRLRLIADLDVDTPGDAQRLAESFLRSPPFVGREAVLDVVGQRIDALVQGKGAAVRVEGAAGMGRSRLLEEIGVRAQVAGARVVRVDASAYRERSGTARALVLRVFDAFPRVSRDTAEAYRPALVALGPDVAVRVRPTSIPPPAPAAQRITPEPRASLTPGEGGGTLEGWLLSIARTKPMVVEIDNVDDADDASLGLLVALAKATHESSLVLVVAERPRREPRTAVGLVTLRGQCESFYLDGFSPSETLALCRSLFGDAPNVERFADWLQDRTAGRPLYCIEISRKLLADGVLRYGDGMWTVPTDRPHAELPADLEEALLMRLAALGEDARSLAECLSLERERPTLALCRLLLGDEDDRRALQALDALARSDVLHAADQGGFVFASTALRDALLRGMDEDRLAGNHRKLGEALLRIAGPEDHELRIEAGWHFIEGGDEVRGAETIAGVTRDSAVVRRLIANLHHVGREIEAALKVFKRHRRSVYERMPLLAALAHAGYYEDRAWGEQYGDEALDACEDLSGIRTARSLRRFLGRWLSMVVGIVFAFVRYRLAPRRERVASFQEMLVQLFGAVTTLTGTASLSLDVERATRVTDVLELFAMLPGRLAPVGIYQFCLGLREIGRERQTQAYASFEKLIVRYEDPQYYLQLPEDARILYVTGAHFARGAFATMRADGRAALESADALERSGLKMYGMVASQLRFLYHANRGELAQAAVHREQVELHAAAVGSAWQVETWESPALIPISSRLRDVVALTRINDRLELMAPSVPSLKLYRRVAHLALLRARGGYNQIEHEALKFLGNLEPRSYIGWAESIAVIARAANENGDFAPARELCASALAHIDDDDREFVTLFLNLDIEMALADAGLGQSDAALARIDKLVERFRDCDHPLVHGPLHEARARICWAAGRVPEYVHSLSIVDRWYRGTGTPALVAKVERLAALQAGPHSRWLASEGPLPEGAEPVTEHRPGAEVSAGYDVPTAVAVKRPVTS
jgi:serine/threonine-protein kinase